MLEMLSYEFMQNAFIAGILVSIASGIIGSIVLVNRMIFLAGGIAHTAYGGIGIAIYFGTPLILTSSIFSIACAIIIAIAMLKNSHRIDTFIGIVWAIGMSLGIILIDLTDGYNTDLMSYLFGSILAVSQDDLIAIAIIDFIIIISMFLFYHKFLAISYDKEFAKLKGIKPTLLYILLFSLIALTVVIAMRVVGLVMVIALLSIPTYIAEQISNSLYMMMIKASIISIFFVIIGLIFAYNYDLSSGASIIMTSAIGFIIFFISQYLLKKR